MVSSKPVPLKPEKKHIIGHEGLRPLFLAIAIGTAGGFVFNWLKMPLAWMLGACVFLNEERPWEQGAERSFGLLRFAPDRDWSRPEQTYRTQTKYPVWDPQGWWWEKDATYPVEQQAEKLAYHAVATAWGPKRPH